MGRQQVKATILHASRRAPKGALRVSGDSFQGLLQLHAAVIFADVIWDNGDPAVGRIRSP
jgi:hypothetical protein